METDTRTVLIYVGTDGPENGILDMKRVTDIVSRFTPGFTAWPASGFWEGHEVATAVIMLSARPALITALVAALKEQLRQECVGVQEMQPLLFA